MWIPSKINAFYLLVVLMSIEQDMSASKLAEATQDLCKNKDRDDFELKLRATMLFRNSLILIDEGWIVYTVPHSNINNSYSQLMIDVLGKPLEEEWPAFKDYANWTRIKLNVVSIYHVDIKTPYLYMLTKGMSGVLYNLNTSKFENSGRPERNIGIRPRIMDNGPIQFVIQEFGKGEGNCGFAIKCLWLGYGNISWGNDGRQMGRTDWQSMGFIYYTWNRTNPDKRNITVIDELTDPSKVISPDFEIKSVALEWQQPTGFLYEGDFYFLDYNNVYTFAVSPLKLVVYPDDQPLHATNPVKITRVKDYFQCVQLNISGKTFPPGAYTLNPGTDSNRFASWIWIVVGVIVLILIVAISALFVWYFSLGSKSHPSKSNGKTSSEAISNQGRATTATVKQSLAVKNNKK